MIKQSKKAGKIPKTAQQTIPYQAMFKEGICQVTDRLFSKTIQFDDINYLLARKEDKEAIFENYCDFLNSFDSSITVQLSFINQQINLADFNNTIQILEQDDQFNDLRLEYTDILKSQIAKGNNGLRKRKFVTFGIESDSPEAAKVKIERIEREILNNFKGIGTSSRPLNGYERLEIMHDIFNTGTTRKLNFNWDLIAKTGLTTKDFIAPNSFDFRERSFFPIGRKFASVSFLQINAPELSDRILADFLDMDSCLMVNMHIQSVAQTQAIKQIQDALSNIDKMKIDEQMKANRGGYDMDILPPELVKSGEQAQKLLDSLQTRNERMFLVTFLVMNLADSKEDLENNQFTAQSIAQQYNCDLRSLDWQQEAGLMASIPIGINEIDIKRGLTTSATAVFVPFTTRELFQKSGLYYGLNAQSQNMIMVDRKKLKNPNGLFLGTPGSGKSFSTKREIVNVMVGLKDDILIVDPEREYSPLVNAFGGQVIKISQDSPDHINPMDIQLNVNNKEDKDYNPMSSKSDFILSFCEQVIGGRNGLEPIEKTLIDRCVLLTYQDYLKTPKPENMPILGDLYNCLKKQDEPEAKRIATGLELYVSGSLNIFNNRTNVDINNRLVCFDTKDLGKQLKKLGMLIMQDQVWNRVTVNRSEGRSTWYYIDEFHLLLREEQTAAASVEIWKRFRKWGGIPTGITQNVNDLLASREVENILQNSDFKYLLAQAPGDGAILADQLNISQHQLSYVTNSPAGEGLLIYDGIIIPFVDRFPEDTKLYKLMTTKPEEVSSREQDE
ncbi:ATP-binding protein (plasmid) [Oscillospiraceae bacterium PP1C4]